MRFTRDTASKFSKLAARRCTCELSKVDVTRSPPWCGTCGL
ncbi:hypothetical protein ACFPRL_31945 [Pseudoclavibacter helvolus]